MNVETLDLLDYRMVYELDSNCRQSLNSIAKRLRINRTVALYRLKRLEKRGVVKGYFTEVNPLALGFLSFRLLLKLGNASKTQQEQLIRYLKDENRIIWLFKVLGNWDVDLVHTARHVFEFEEFKQGLFLKFNSIIESSQISILTQIDHFPRDYLVSHERRLINRKRFHPVPSHFTPDRVDLKLLQLLSENARMNILGLAEKLGISANTTRKRMALLAKNGIILGYRLNINTAKLGYQYYKWHLNLRDYTQSERDSLQSYFESKSFVIYIDHYLSGDDFEIELHLHDEQEFLQFLDETMARFGKIIKEQYLLKFYEELVFRYLPALPQLKEPRSVLK